MGWGAWQGLKKKGSGSSTPTDPALTCRELTLQKGDIVYIHKEVDKNWLEGEHHGRLGIFPANYVEVSGRDGASRLGDSMAWERLRRRTPGFLAKL